MSPITISVAIIVAFIIGVTFTSIFWYFLLRRYMNVIDNYETINQSMVTSLGTQAAITKEFLNDYRLDQPGTGPEVPD